MKAKYLIALVLLFIGANSFTFATARYWTTEHVLTQARERMDAALRKEGLYEQVYPPNWAHRGALTLAIGQAGGLYYWWNDGLIYWGAAIVLILSGVAVTFYEPRGERDASGKRPQMRIEK